MLLKRIHCLSWRALVILPTFGLALGFSTASSAETSSAANFDWSSFVASASGPDFSFIRDDGLFGTTATAFTQAFASDWTSSIAAGDSSSSATANSASLSTTLRTPDGASFPPRSADITRAGSFTLGAGSSVTFAVDAGVSTNMAADPGNTSFASLAALGGDAGFYISSFDLFGNGLQQSRQGLLTITVSNTSPDAVTGYLAAEGTLNAATVSVSPVPELPTVTLMMSGLLLAGVAARARRR